MKYARCGPQHGERYDILGVHTPYHTLCGHSKFWRGVVFPDVGTDCAECAICYPTITLNHKLLDHARGIVSCELCE